MIPPSTPLLNPPKPANPTPPTEADILADPAHEIQTIDSGEGAARDRAWARWKAYDTNFFAAFQKGKVPWIGTVMLYGWSPYRNMLNQRTEMNALGNQWFYPTPSELAALVVAN